MALVTLPLPAWAATKLEQRWIELTGFSVEIVGLNTAGDPQDLMFRFSVPLEDTSLRWLAWGDGAYAPWTPPAVGESTRLPAPKGIFE